MDRAAAHHSISWSHHAFGLRDPSRPRWHRSCSSASPGVEVPPRTLSSYVACNQPLTVLESMPMALFRMWRRVQNFQRWKKTTIPMLLNVDTGEVLPFSSYTAPPSGKWILRRPLTLPESTLPLFLEAPLIPGGLAVRKRAGASNPLHLQAGLRHNIGVTLPPPQRPV